ncbi:MAG TPA: AsmA family protein, partial [Candidatus Limnocylindria bacterium]|nr:AsmA family protein [Candidatus Limnocylindria bacterium]
MKIPRKLLTALLLAVAVAAAGLAQTFKVIAGKNLNLVRLDLQKVFGSDLDFDGLEVSLFPRPGFLVKGIRVADDTRFAATPVFRTRELILGVHLWNLVRGRIVIDSLIFKESELQVITDEAGMLNLTALIGRRKGLRLFPRMDAITLDNKPGGVSFAIRELQVRGGRIDYLDRSVQGAAELQIRNIDLTVRGFNPTETMGIRVAAALADGLSQDVRIDGEFGPQEADKLWSQRPIEVAIRFDSLYAPVIARAVAALRDRFPRALNVTGPMALQAKVSGTIERPKIDDFSLKIPLFGSSEYNAVATGAIAFSERRSWATAELDGKLSVTSVDIDRLRDLPFVAQLVPPAMTANGAVSIFSRVEGSWEALRVGALLVANRAEFRFHDWLQKPAGVAAEIRTGISRQKHKILFHESQFVVGAVKTQFTGSVETLPVPRVSLLI